MSKWADEFFVTWQKAWSTGTGEVMKYVTDDIEYWDVTLDEPIRGADAYAEYCDGFFAAFTECEFTMREPVIHEGDRVTEPWAFRGLNSGPLWIGLPATGRRVETHGTDIFEFRDGKVCREHSYTTWSARCGSSGSGRRSAAGPSRWRWVSAGQRSRAAPRFLRCRFPASPGAPHEHPDQD